MFTSAATPRRSFGPVGARAAYLGDGRCKTVLLAEGVENALAGGVDDGRRASGGDATREDAWQVASAGGWERAVVFATGTRLGAGRRGG